MRFDICDSDALTYRSGQYTTNSRTLEMFSLLILRSVLFPDFPSPYPSCLRSADRPASGLWHFTPYYRVFFLLRNAKRVVFQSLVFVN